MGENKAFKECTAANLADGACQVKQNCLSEPILLSVWAVFVQINLYTYAMPLLDVTSANPTLP